MKLNEGGKVFPVGGNVARKAHRNDNPHLDRLHPPQTEELVAQKQVRFLNIRVRQRFFDQVGHQNH